MNSSYQSLLDKALSQLRMLEIDKALVFFYQLLTLHPDDLLIIEHIYKIEKRKKANDGFCKICHHIFSLESMAASFHQRMIDTYVDYKERIGISLTQNSFSKTQIYNLFFHLGQTSYTKDTSLFLKYIKEQLADEKYTARALFNYCEQLVKKKQIIQAKEEINYLMIYYTEADTQLAAEKLLKKI